GYFCQSGSSFSPEPDAPRSADSMCVRGKPQDRLGANRRERRCGETDQARAAVRRKERSRGLPAARRERARPPKTQAVRKRSSRAVSTGERVREIVPRAERPERVVAGEVHAALDLEPPRHRELQAQPE